MRIRYSKLLCLGLLVAAQANAGDFFEPRMYAGLAGGQLTLDNSKVDFSEHSSAWEIFVGFEFNRFLAVELGRADGGSPTLTTRVPIGTTPQTYDVFDDVISTQAWHGSALGSWPFNDTVSVYARGGLSNWKTTSRQKLNGTTYFPSTSFPGNPNRKGTDPYFGLGVAVNIDNGMLRLEYTLSSVSATFLSTTTTPTPTRYDFDTSYISLGVAWRFGF